MPCLMWCMVPPSKPSSRSRWIAKRTLCKPSVPRPMRSINFSPRKPLTCWNISRRRTATSGSKSHSVTWCTTGAPTKLFWINRNINDTGSSVANVFSIIIQLTARNCNTKREKRKFTHKIMLIKLLKITTFWRSIMQFQFSVAYNCKYFLHYRHFTNSIDVYRILIELKSFWVHSLFKIRTQTIGTLMYWTDLTNGITNKNHMQSENENETHEKKNSCGDFKSVVCIVLLFMLQTS